MCEHVAGVAQLVERQLPKLTTHFVKSTEPSASRSTSTSTSQSPANQTKKTTDADPDLAKLIDAWPTLPEPLKEGIRAMVEAAIVTQE